MGFGFGVQNGPRHEFGEKNPFAAENEEVASVAYRYRKWKLDEVRKGAFTWSGSGGRGGRYTPQLNCLGGGMGRGKKRRCFGRSGSCIRIGTMTMTMTVMMTPGVGRRGVVLRRPSWWLGASWTA